MDMQNNVYIYKILFGYGICLSNMKRTSNPIMYIIFYFRSFDKKYI